MSSSSTEKPLSLKAIKDSYLLTASEIKALTKPYRLENVKPAAIKKFGVSNYFQTIKYKYIKHLKDLDYSHSVVT